jgi:branched-subunit amino acid aminotransferase/4-amino-4-deoxychorismate lyase
MEKAEIVPFGPLTLSPATAVFHTRRKSSRGFKAYHQPDGPAASSGRITMTRLNNSAARMGMAQVVQSNSSPTSARWSRQQIRCLAADTYVGRACSRSIR